MNYYNQNQPPVHQHYEDSAVVAQTNSVLKKVYVRMFLGLLISAFCALAVASSPGAFQFFVVNQWVYWGMFIAMLVMCFVLPAKLNSMSTTTAMLLFFLFSAMMGTSLSAIFVVYDIGAITQTFFITAGVFGAMSCYGYFTKSDLSKMGTYLIMGLFGIIIASIVNIFLGSDSLAWIISILGVVIFVGLTAWDTQQIKRMAQANLNPALSDKLATLGALNLYLDFINLFLFLLRIFGGGRD